MTYTIVVKCSRGHEHKGFWHGRAYVSRVGTCYVV